MPRILIIDDEHLVRETVKTIFRANGYEVVAMEDGPSGIEAARAQKFDLVIVDLFMPGMDGLKVISAIRKDNPLLPMIAASGFLFGDKCPVMPNFDAIAAEAGATATLYKPFRPKELLSAVEGAMQRVT